jgi:group I intron endonuclease
MIDMKKSGIYKITCVPTGKVYVGSAFDLARRQIEHRYHLKRGDHHCLYLQNAWNKHGADNFQFEIIEECSIELLQTREQFWLDFYRTTHPDLVFNIALVIPAPMAGRTQTVETRSKISAAQKGVSVPSRGQNRSAESVEKTAASHRGRKRSPETCARISAAKRGRAITPAQQAQNKRLAESNRGKPLSEERRKKISDAKMGKPGKKHTIESRAKMAIVQSNRPPISEETRERMSAARKAFWERKRAEKAEIDHDN